jgi:hypothetical protein
MKSRCLIRPNRRPRISARARDLHLSNPPPRAVQGDPMAEVIGYAAIFVLAAIGAGHLRRRSS